MGIPYYYHALTFLLLFLVTRAKIPAVIVFGDSSVDAGNNNELSTVLKSNFKPYGRDFPEQKSTGRFSNGRVPSDFISEAFEVKPIVPAYLDRSYNLSDFATGVCFASAGTGYDNLTSDVLSVIPLWKQLEYYKDYQKKLQSHIGKHKSKKLLKDSLYLISIGTNDFLENYYATFPRQSPRMSQFPSVQKYQDFLAHLAGKFLHELYLLGARKVSLGGLPPMGCLPLKRTENMINGRDCIVEYNDVALEFNRKLKVLVHKVNRDLPGIRVVLSDPYECFIQLIRKPSSYGFDVSTMACCATGTFEMGYMCDRFNPFTCTDARKYVFWDSFHPTERTSQILSDHLVKTALSVFF